MDSFDEIYKQYYKLVYFYIFGLCGNRDVAEEVTQESFFRALRKINSFKENSSIKTWIITIARNVFFDYCKKKKLEPLCFSEYFVSDESDDNPEENVTASGADLEKEIQDKETARIIRKAAENLPEPYKEVFALRTFGELSFKEIGETSGKTESWARVTYHRARLMIKENLKDEV